MQNVRITDLDETVRRCKRCGSSILWATTLAGKRMPVQTTAVVHYLGAPEEDAEKPYWNLPADKTHFPHCAERSGQRSADTKQARYQGERR